MNRHRLASAYSPGRVALALGRSQSHLAMGEPISSTITFPSEDGTQVSASIWRAAGGYEETGAEKQPVGYARHS